MENLDVLITILRKALKNDESTNTKEIVTINDLLLKDILNNYEIKYEILNESRNIKIFLDNPHLIIFKSVEDAIIVEPKISFKKTLFLTANINQDVVFENIVSFFKLKDIITNKEFTDFDDKGQKISYLLSPDYGKIPINYKPDTTKKLFYTTKHNLNFEKLENLLKQDSYKGFFKSSVAKFLSEKSDKNLYKILENLNFLIDKSENDLNLYKHNFSFEEFKKEFDKDLSDEMKRMQELVSNFHGKVSTIPLQFGAFAYLLSNVKDNKTLLILSILIIICWAGFNYFTTVKTFSNIQNLEDGINIKMTSLIEKSGLEKKEIDKKSSVLFAEVCNVKSLINYYQIFCIVFTVLFLIIYFLKY